MSAEPLDQPAGQPVTPSDSPPAESQIAPDQPFSDSFTDFLNASLATPQQPTEQQQVVEQPQETTTTEVAAPEVVEPGLRDSLRALGYTALADRYQTDDEALRGLIEAQSLVGRRNEELAQLRAWHQQFTAAQQQQLQPKPAQPETPQPKAAWDAPPYDPAWIAQIHRNKETGALEGPDEAIQGLKRWQAWSERAGIDLLRDPETKLGPVIEKVAARVAQQLYETQQQQSQQQQLVAQVQQTTDQFIRENSGWMFVGGNPQSQQLTPIGQAFGQAYIAHMQELPPNMHPIRAHQLAADYAAKAVTAGYSTQELARMKALQPPAPTKKPNAALMSNTPAVQAPSPENPEALVKDGESLKEALYRLHGLNYEAA